jgi:hypothetical protein
MEAFPAIRIERGSCTAAAYSFRNPWISISVPCLVKIDVGRMFENLTNI